MSEKGCKSLIYLDNSATTRADEQVVTAMNKYFLECYGNPSSLHRMGLEAEKAMNKARKQVAGFLKVDEKTITFVSGGTEGNNLAIRSAINKNKRLGNKIITSAIEHPSVLEVFKSYENNGYDVFYIDVDKKGFLDLEQLEEALDDKTILVSIMKVNNEVGSIQNTREIAKIIKERSQYCIFHSDCVQAVGKVPVEPLSEGIDILTFSGHKIHGPKGIGAIYVRKDLALQPILFGGGQERGFRSGTENLPGVVGIGVAVEQLSQFQQQVDHLQALKSKAIELLKAELSGIHFNSDESEKYAPHVLNISIEDVKSEVLLHLLEKKEIFISSGSACTSKKNSQSHVLKSMNLSSKYIEGSLRISFSKYNTLEEIEYMVKMLKESVDNVRKFTRRR